MVAVATKEFRWGVERRLEFVEFQLYWEGGINRSDIIDEFGVSVPQASKDLALYQEQALDNIAYNAKEKRYFASETFHPKFIKLDATEYLNRLANIDSNLADVTGTAIGSIAAERLPLPQRHIEPNSLRNLLTALRRKQSIEIYYQSMNNSRSGLQWRRISPHAFASDGLRWHVRAYCHLDHKFKDFILSRCLNCRDLGQLGLSQASDEQWNSLFKVVLIPNPKLNQGQREIIAQDFAMVDGCAIIPVRRAMLYYFCKRLRLDLASSDPKETPVVVANREDLDSALTEAMR